MTVSSSCLLGRAKVLLQNNQGHEVILSIVESPDVFGHLALLDGAPRSATVVALDDVVVTRVDRDQFLDLLSKNRRLLEHFLRQLVQSLRETNEQVRTALLFDVHGQIIRALVRCARTSSNTAIVVQPRPTHEEIGQMIGKKRETVSRGLKLLKEGGYLSSDPDLSGST